MSSDYRRGRTLPADHGLPVGLIGGRREIETAYERVGQLRHPPLRVRRLPAAAIGRAPEGWASRVEHPAAGGRWIVNDSVRAPMLVGAGGHFCPVARQLNDGLETAPISAGGGTGNRVCRRAGHGSAFSVAPENPELYFCRDLKGYGWCFRKQGYVNIGLGRADRHQLPKATAEFVAFLERRRKIPPARSWRWRGHAYLLHGGSRRAVGDGVVLVGDAAGLAYPQSGEGIRPAIESGLFAASTILGADGHYSREQLEPYENSLAERLGGGWRAGALSSVIAARALAPVAGFLLQVPGFVRHVALERWFLHADVPPLAVA